MRVTPLALGSGLLAACDLPGGGGETGETPGSLASVIDFSVNRASATPGEDGGLRLYTAAGDNPAGGFNGTGTGNKAIGGLPGYDGLPLADLTGLAFETTAVTGSWTPYLNLIVDLDCASASYTLVVADDTRSGPPTETAAGAWRYEFSADQAEWAAVGGVDGILPGHLEAEGGSLADLVAAYPAACLRDAASGDSGMPAGEVTSAFLVILGDSLNTTEAEHRISALEVGADRYE